MEQRHVDTLERELETAIAGVFAGKIEWTQPPAPPSRQTLRMMAKAAATVYEAVADESARRGRDG